MKKSLVIIMSIIMLAATFLLPAFAADIAPEFSGKFFPNGKIGTITDVYYQMMKDDNGDVYSIYMWLTQPEDIIAMFTEQLNVNDEEAWKNTYKSNIDECRIQLDCKVDDGDWHYCAEWDVGEYPQPDQPYDLALRQSVPVEDGSKTFKASTAVLDAGYAGDDGAGYLKPIVKTTGDNLAFDLENHSLTLRARYILKYYNDEDASFLLSDWSDEVKIGKDGTQATFEKPEKLEPMTLSQLTFVDSYETEDGTVMSNWKVFVDYPQSNGDAQKYYVIEEDAFEPLCASIEYRVLKDGEWGDWQSSYWANPTDLISGWKSFTAEGIDKNDTLEFRAFIENNVDSEKNSPYSESVFCNNTGTAETPAPATLAPTEPAETLAPSEEPAPAKDKCKVCGICPFQPLGICLFIWLLIIIIIIIAVIVVLKILKKKKEEDDKEDKKN